METSIVRPGDTLYIIAKQFGIPLEQLIGANPELANPNQLYIGQTIIIPEMMPAPEQLEIITATAEEIIDHAYLAEWEQAMNKVAVLRRNMAEVLPVLQRALVREQYINKINTSINNLERNISQRRTYPAISQANQVTMSIPDILDYFAVTLPTDIGRIEYLARQIIVNVEMKDWSEAYANYQRLRKVWGRLSLRLESTYRYDVAGFDQILDSLGEAINIQDYRESIEVTGRVLRAISIIEGDFIEQYRENY